MPYDEPDVVASPPEVEVDWEDNTLEVDEDALIIPDEALPSNLFVYALSSPMLFPGMLTPIRVEGEHAEILIDQVKAQNRYLAFLANKDPSDNDGETAEPLPSKLAREGVVGRLVRVLKMPDGSVTALVQALARMHVTRWVRQTPFLIAHVEYPEETCRDPARTEALVREIQTTLKTVLDMMPGIPEEFSVHFFNIEDSNRLADFLGAHFPLNAADRQVLISSFDITERLERVLEFLVRELELRKVGLKIRDELKEKIETQQKAFLLREQLKAIKQELGEEMDEKDADKHEYEDKIAEANLPGEVLEKALKELKRMDLLPTEAMEYHVIRSYLDWLTELPWDVETADNVDLDHALRILNQDHQGLADIKERIIEVLAVRKLRPDAKGPVLCFVGPPGVGKTSLGASIARALGREFFRFSLGGMRDEAEIKGHRRTYVGAMPGKIIQGLKRAGSRNPVFVLDEIDKLGNDWRGDPSSAMLEVLDPSQNHTFMDHYLDVPFDLSKTMFIATANNLDTIPAPLRDRMEIIELGGYIEEEKVEIAARHLLDRQRKEVGITGAQLQVPRRVLREVVRGWTREAGVRNLDREIGKLARKAATAIAREMPFPPRISLARLPELLGPRKFTHEMHDQLRRPGVSIGLAWTPVGGEILFIECSKMKGKGNIILTGKLGEVMTESAQLAMSFLRSNAERFGLEVEALEKLDVHVHFPAGAVPKDGPSAGAAIATALLSLLSGERLIRPRLAMTGELTLTGKILPVGGIKEKILGALRAGIHTVLLPRQNESDLADLPASAREGLTIHLVDDYEEVMALAFEDPPKPRGKSKSSQK
jgi:ATP-dependent Lon protease